MTRMKAFLLILLLLPIPSWAMSYFEELGWINSESKVPSLLLYPEQVEALYQDEPNLIWHDMQESTQLEFQLEIIQRAGFSPLISRQLSYLRFYRKSNLWYEYDLLATDTLIFYMSYAEQAKRMGHAWFFEGKLNSVLPPPSEEALFELRNSASSSQLAELIETYTPDTNGYMNLINAYLEVAHHQGKQLPKYQQSGVKRVGDQLENKPLLLERLKVVDVDLDGVRIDISWYDKTLEVAIKQFQGIHGLYRDGVIGPNTMKWLNMAVEDRMAMLALNAERARIWPDQRERLILVNVPGFDMEYWYGGESVFTSRVVVGRETRQTPVMVTNLNALILNPSWNVPWKIMVEDIIPKVQEDIGYLEKMNIEIIPKWGSSETINPIEIDWETLNPKAFPYKMRQMSGDYNALGLYKFNTPNNRAIFLHDTPSKSLFNRASRAFSSGCVRVQYADKFANLLLKSQGLDTDRIKAAEDTANKAISLRKRIPVHIIYQTAWSEKGTVQYREDIYSLDRLNSTKG
ncbi:murein L,D-transpeptidase [Vibrio sinensis]|uniref:Murein L,D-transpeptidase n=1 Tax=Vibrio sinensis TaxID=2302434 RepID=A0A3A6Q961_9VIBR|nr:L,D-transpeptidase family protein [Vibrio sinensis]RJX68376.1 murein L,D-transpeptidase [Vibrio sinensis]